MDGNCSSMIAIGKRIREKREELKLTQEELGKIIGVSRVVVSYWESGSRDIKTGDIVLLADTLGVTTDYLLGRTGDPNQQPCAVDELGLTVVEIHKILQLNNDPACKDAWRYLLSAKDFPMFVACLKRYMDEVDELSKAKKLLDNSEDAVKLRELLVKNITKDMDEDEIITTSLEAMADFIGDIEKKNSNLLQQLGEIPVDQTSATLYRLQRILGYITDSYAEKKGVNIIP